PTAGCRSPSAKDGRSRRYPTSSPQAPGFRLAQTGRLARRAKGWWRRYPVEIRGGSSWGTLLESRCRIGRDLVARDAEGFVQGLIVGRDGRLSTTFFRLPGILAPTRST